MQLQWNLIKTIVKQRVVQSETGEDDDDLLIDSDNTNEEGLGICFETSILMVVAVLLFALCWMLNLEMSYMKSGCPDIEYGDNRYYFWYVQVHYLGQPDDVFGMLGLSIWICETI